MQETVIGPGKRNCPACGATAGREGGLKRGFLLLWCESCRTTYVAQMPDPYGSQDYDDYYSAANLTVPAFVESRLDEIVASYSAYRQNNRLLDIGFGAGALLQAAARAGWAVKGVEVSLPAVEQGRALGFDVYYGELSEACYPTGHFDVVTASEVLEHIADSQALIREIARVLRPGGLLWATTPNGRGGSSRVLGSRWSIVSPPEHLQLFSITGMKALLDAVGFRQIDIITQGMNPFEILYTLSHPRTTRG